jgi:hypothetical protein
MYMAPLSFFQSNVFLSAELFGVCVCVCVCVIFIKIRDLFRSLRTIAVNGPMLL